MDRAGLARKHAALLPFLLISVIALAISLVAIPAIGQLGAIETSKATDGDTEPAPFDSFDDEIAVLEVEVPVRVLRRGEPVRGLEQKDFEVYSKGKRLEVIGFEAVDLSVTAPIASDLANSNRAEVAPQPEQVFPERHLLALFDVTQPDRHRLSLAVQGVRDVAADRLHPADRLGVALWSAGGVDFVLGFTSDKERINLALDVVEAVLDAKGRRVRELAEQLAAGRESGLRELTRSVGPTAALALGSSLEVPTDPGGFGELDLSLLNTPGDDGIASEVEEAFEIGTANSAGAVLSSIRRMNDSLGSLATVLRDVPGERYLLLFSRERGAAARAIALRGSGEDAIGPGTGTGAGFLRSFESLVDSFRRAGWVINAFHIGGGAEGLTSNVGGLGFDTLSFMATETGGEIYRWNNRLDEAAAKMLDSTAVIYRLIVQASDVRRDGAYHALDVRVPGERGVKVRAREGFYGPRTWKEMSAMEKRLAAASQLFDAPDSRELPVRSFMTTSPIDDQRSLVSVVLALSPELVSDESAARRLRLDIEGFASDWQSGRDVVLDIFREEIELDFEEHGELLDLGGLKFVGDLEVPAGHHRVRFRVRDPVTGREYRSTHDLRTGDESPQDPRLLAYFVRPGGQSVVVREAHDSAAESERSPFRIGTSSLLPNPEPRLEDGSALLVRAWGEWSPSSRLVAEILPAGGDVAHPAPIRFGEMRPIAGGSAGLSTLQLQDFSPGAYTIELRWLDGDREIAATRLSFRKARLAEPVG